MRKQYKFSFVFLLCIQLFYCSKLFAQVEISGKIYDKKQNKPLANAIIILNKFNTDIAFAYALSKTTGQFELKTTTKEDSLTIIVKFLGYATQKLNILNKSQTINIPLEPASIELKEVKVTPEPIKKYGDTISYAVSAFKDKNDRVIADIIKKLPGIEVNANGQILYQGEPINKYYIEGMDLLEGRYKLANENLNVDAVTNVEILENHQSIRMLNGVVFSEKAALNIKLKKNLTTAGQMSIGVGFAPFLRDLNITPMVFTKKTQILISYQTNNVGRNISNQLMRLTPDDFRRGFTDLENKQDWLRIQQLNPPPFNENRWLDNNNHIGSFNMLKTIGISTELRLICDYSNDIQKQEGSTKTLYFNSPTDTIRLFENKVNRLFLNDLKTDLTIQKNTTSTFLKNSLKFKAYWDTQTGIINNANGTLTQQLSNPFFTISNQFKDLLKMGKSILTLNFNISFERKPQNLFVTPGQFSGLLNGNKPFNTVQQGVVQNSFFMENSIQFMKIVRSFSFDTQIGFLVEKQNLMSDLTTKNGDSLTTIGGEFSNNLDWLNQKYYISLQSRYKKEKWNINLETPIYFYTYSIQDKNLGKVQKLNLNTFEPRVSGHYELNKFWMLNFSSGISNVFGNINQMYYGYIMTSYRDIKRANTLLSQTLNFTNLLSLSYRNPINSTFGSIIYNHSTKMNNLLFVNTIALNGTNELNAIEKENKNYSQILNGSIGKYFRKIKTNVALNGTISNQQGEQIINTQLSKVSSKSISPSLRISSSFSTWFGFEYNYKLSNIQNKIDDIRKSSIIQQSHEIKLNFNSESDWYLGIKGDFQTNNFSNKQYLSSDLTLKKTVKLRKIDLELNWVNIFNTKTFSTLTTGDFTYIETTYNLRPSQIICRMRIPF